MTHVNRNKYKSLSFRPPTELREQFTAIVGSDKGAITAAFIAFMERTVNENERLKKTLSLINNHFETKEGWKIQSSVADEAIGSLSPNDILRLDGLIHPDLTPYLSAYHVAWLFAIAHNPEDLTYEHPYYFDPSKPLSEL